MKQSMLLCSVTSIWDWAQTVDWLVHWVSGGPLSKSAETFRAHFGWLDSLCIFKTKASRGMKLRSYFDFYSLYNIWKDQLYWILGLEFYEWLFGPQTFSRLSRNVPQTPFRGISVFATPIVLFFICGAVFYSSRRTPLFNTFILNIRAE